jgi:tRNA(adenine34) deaminase
VAIGALVTEADRRWVAVALDEAATAGTRGEVPVGAVVVRAGIRLAAAGNRNLADGDPTAHAEIVALREAARVAGNHRLPDCTLYATVEPCLMCMGAALHARIERVVYGCADPKGGAAASLYTLGDDPRLNHRITVVGGVAEGACREVLQRFFRARRGR